jgi:hypothetical protein
MGRRSFNGGGTLLVVSEFDHNEMGSPPPNWRSRYMEFSEVKFRQNLRSWLFARRLELEKLIEGDASYILELDRVKLFLTDLEAHFAEASAYVLGPSREGKGCPETPKARSALPT